MGRTIAPKKEINYTRDEIQTATRKFQSEGGLIKHLPDQKMLVNVLVPLNLRARHDYFKQGEAPGYLD
ncbi:MAG: hypothetical protein AABX93_03165 [Nanoarchaeota archaeon]